MKSVAGAVPANAAPEWPELDLFRGLAAVLMVLNHGGVAWLGREAASTGLTGALVFAGSFAPVLFFFATGVALALPGQAERGLNLDRLWKCALLFIADQFLFWSRGASLGLDFFGFIALSMLVLYLLGPLRRAEAWAVVLLVGLLVVRFAVGPVVKAQIPSTGLLAFLTGIFGQDGISYPLSPWLAYPLVGFLFGRARLRGRALPGWAWWFAAALCLGFALLAYRKGMSFHRWSSMALGYFVLSLGVLLVAWALAQWQRATPTLGHLLALRGVAAFLVVPMHYAWVKVGVLAGLTALAAWQFLTAVLVLIAASFWMSRWLAGLATRFVALPGVVWPVLIGMGVLAFASVSMARDAALIAFATATLGQLAAAAMLARRKVNASV